MVHPGWPAWNMAVDTAPPVENFFSPWWVITVNLVVLRQRTHERIQRSTQEEAEDFASVAREPIPFWRTARAPCIAYVTESFGAIGQKQMYVQSPNMVDMIILSILVCYWFLFQKVTGKVSGNCLSVDSLSCVESPRFTDIHQMARSHAADYAPQLLPDYDAIYLLTKQCCE